MRLLVLLIAVLALPAYSADVTSTTGWTAINSDEPSGSATIDSGSNRKFILWGLHESGAELAPSVTVGGQSPTETIGPFVVTETNGDHHHYLYVWDETAIGSMLGTTISYSDGGGNFTKGFLWGTIEDTDQSALSNFTGTAFNLAASSLNVTSTSSAGDLIVCGSIASHPVEHSTWDTLTEIHDSAGGDDWQGGFAAGDGGDDTTTITYASSQEVSATCIVFPDADDGLSFTAVPTLNDCDDSSCTFDFTVSLDATVYGAAYTLGASAPEDCDAVIAASGAEDSTSVMATGEAADQITLDSVMIGHDYYFCADDTEDQTDVQPVLAVLRDARMGFEIVTNAGLSGTSPFAQPVAECDTDGSTAVLTGCDDTADIAVGMLVTVSDGFPSAGPYVVLAKTASTLTLDTASDSMESGETVTGLVDESGNAYFNPAIATSDLFEVATASSQGGSIVWDTGLDFIYTPEMGESELFASIEVFMQDASGSSGSFTRPDTWPDSPLLVYLKNSPPTFALDGLEPIALPVGEPIDAIDVGAFCDHDHLTPTISLRSGSSLPANLTLSDGVISGTVASEDEDGFSVDLWCNAGGLYALQTWTAYPIDTVTMPNVVGLDLTSAIDAITAEFPWRDGSGISASFRCHADDGEVIAQDPAASEEMTATEGISLVVAMSSLCRRGRLLRLGGF